MAQVKDRPQIISEIKDDISSERIFKSWSDPDERELWEQFEEMEEEDLKEASYEIYEPAPPEEREIGKIIRDSFGIYKVNVLYYK